MLLGSSLRLNLRSFPSPYPSLSALLSAPFLSLPYPATTDGIDDYFQLDHERGTMPVCIISINSNEITMTTREERDREWEEQGRTELTRRRRSEWLPLGSDALALVWSMWKGWARLMFRGLKCFDGSDFALVHLMWWLVGYREEGRRRGEGGEKEGRRRGGAKLNSMRDAGDIRREIEQYHCIVSSGRRQCGEQQGCEQGHWSPLATNGPRPRRPPRVSRHLVFGSLWHLMMH